MSQKLELPNGKVLELVQGDITDQVVDAIVNAANSYLAGGGGVDGAIHRRGGPEIMEETRRCYPNGCPTGSAVISGAGKLQARYVIHAVGPVWHGGKGNAAERLQSAYKTCLQLADENELTSIAFPSISTGAYRYPLDEAAPLALRTVVEHLRGKTVLQVVRFVLFDQQALRAYEKALKELD